MNHPSNPFSLQWRQALLKISCQSHPPRTIDKNRLNDSPSLETALCASLIIFPSINCVSAQNSCQLFSFFISSDEVYLQSERKGIKKNRTSSRHTNTSEREIVRWTTRIENVVALASTCFTFAGALAVASVAFTVVSLPIPTAASPAFVCFGFKRKLCTCTNPRSCT